ncbi:MAG: cation transporter [Propionibacteriaceae bacterium]|jgi:copper chaperone CopZ|nr:cation transporter [Propionibacteriaceae bacterium]
MLASYDVKGLTCQHCVNHVLEEVQAIPGVDGATLTLAEAVLRVTSAAPVDAALVAAAAAEAGDYTVTARTA